MSEGGWKMLCCWFEDGERATSLGTRAPLEAGKDVERILSGAPKRKQACGSFISHFSPREQSDNTFVLFKNAHPKVNSFIQ